MKKTTFTRLMPFLMAGACIFALVACVKIKSIQMPHEVAPRTSFTVEIDADINHEGGDLDFWGCVGVRVPEGWTVEAPENACRLLSNSFEHYASGLVLNPFYTDYLNNTEEFRKEGYVWFGFSTGYDAAGEIVESVDADGKVTRTYKITEIAGNPMIHVFNGEYLNRGHISLVVTPGATEGDYKLDFTLGYEDWRFSNYSERAWNYKSITSCNMTTFNSAKGDQWPTNCEVRNVVEAETGVKVKVGAGLEYVSADTFEIMGGTDGCITVVAKGADACGAVATVFDAAGVQTDCRVLTGDETLLHASKGVNVVRLLKGDRTLTRKVFVK